MRLLRLQSLTAHRREPPEPSLPLNLLRNIFDFLPVWIPPRELDALQECAESYAVGLLQDSLLLAIHRHSADSNGAFESAECHGACHGAVWPLDVETAWRINGSGTVFSGEVSTAEGSLAAATASVAEMDASQQLCRSCATVSKRPHMSYGLRQGVRRLSFRAGITFLLDSSAELVVRYMTEFCVTIFSVGTDPGRCAPQLKHARELTRVCEDLFSSDSGDSSMDLRRFLHGAEPISDSGRIPLAVFTDSESDEDDEAPPAGAMEQFGLELAQIKAEVNTEEIESENASSLAGLTLLPESGPTAGPDVGSSSILRTLEDRRTIAAFTSGISILGIRYYDLPRSLIMDYDGPMVGETDHEDNPCAASCSCPIHTTAGYKDIHSTPTAITNPRVQVGTETFTVGTDTHGIISCCPLCATDHRFIEFKCDNTVNGPLVHIDEELFAQVSNITEGDVGDRANFGVWPVSMFTQRFVVDLDDRGAPVVSNLDLALDRVARRAGMIGPAMHNDAKSLLAKLAVKWVENIIVYATESCYTLPSEGHQVATLHFTHIALALGWQFRNAGRSEPFSLHQCGPFRLCVPPMTDGDIARMKSEQLAQIEGCHRLASDEDARSKAKQRLNDMIAVLQMGRGKQASDDRTRAKRQKSENRVGRLAELLSSSRGVPPIPGATSGPAQCDPDLVKYISEDAASGWIDHGLIMDSWIHPPQTRYELDKPGTELIAWALERYLETILACAVGCAVHSGNQLNMRWDNDAEFRSEVIEDTQPARCDFRPIFGPC